MSRTLLFGLLGPSLRESGLPHPAGVSLVLAESGLVASLSLKFPGR
jgi:hypothetical protein